MSGSPVIPDPAGDALLGWYAAHGRTLAFRRTRDPWAILVSEVIAQQTQAARAAERWETFMRRFRTVDDLAIASTADVLRAWQGLGYDRRGLRLQRAARAIVAEHGGRVPSSIDALEALPGIGPYTARAVAAIAFGLRVGAVDVNVRRVLGRMVAGSTTGLGGAAMQALADAMVPEGRAAAWTHALMDLGATVCRPRDPRCDVCPVRRWCRFAADPASSEPSTTRPTTPFPETDRWLRGRILDRLRAAADATWVTIHPPIGSHGIERIRRAVLAMAADGLLELDGDVETGAIRARLPA